MEPEIELVEPYEGVLQAGIMLCAYVRLATEVVTPCQVELPRPPGVTP